MNRFPQAVFRAGGAETIEGKPFTSKMVNNEDELKAATDDGFHETVDDATAAADQAAEAAAAALKQKADAADADGEKPTRPELEQKATEMGIAFKPSTSDKKLAEAINAKLADQAAEAAAAAGA